MAKLTFGMTTHEIPDYIDLPAESQMSMRDY